MRTRQDCANWRAAARTHWARQLQTLGLRVKLIASEFVKPYVKSNKNDANDAEALCEAMSRPSMRFVSVKSMEQQDIRAAHRIRAGQVEPARHQQAR